MKDLTVLVPAFNMERYLADCLNSLINTNCHDSLEVIVIDDGSTDNTARIADLFCQYYPNVIKVIHKKNGNYGSCVNRGLLEAQGRYVRILDADDVFDSSVLAEYMDFLRTTDADLIISDYAITDVNRNVQKIVRYDLEGKKKFQSICNEGIFRDNIQMHAVAYKRACFANLNYRQMEGISYTDQQWIFTPMVAVEYVDFFRKPLYHYMLGREGQTMDPAVLTRNFDHSCKCCIGIVLDYTKLLPMVVGQPVQNYFQYRVLRYIRDIYISSFFSYTKERKLLLVQFDNQLKEVNSKIYNDVAASARVCGLSYIKFWRKNTKCPLWIINCAAVSCRLIVKIRNSRVMKNKIFDSHAEA